MPSSDWGPLHRWWGPYEHVVDAPPFLVEETERGLRITRGGEEWSTVDWTAGKTLVALALMREVVRLKTLLDLEKVRSAKLEEEINELVEANLDDLR